MTDNTYDNYIAKYKEIEKDFQSLIDSIDLPDEEVERSIFFCYPILLNYDEEDDDGISVSLMTYIQIDKFGPYSDELRDCVDNMHSLILSKFGEEGHVWGINLPSYDSAFGEEDESESESIIISIEIPIFSDMNQNQFRELVADERFIELQEKEIEAVEILSDLNLHFVMWGGIARFSDSDFVYSIRDWIENKPDFRKVGQLKFREVKKIHKSTLDDIEMRTFLNSLIEKSKENKDEDEIISEFFSSLGRLKKEKVFLKIVRLLRTGFAQDIANNHEYKSDDEYQKAVEKFTHSDLVRHDMQSILKEAYDLISEVS